MILRYAFLKQIKADQLRALLDNTGIEDAYRQARDYLRADFTALYEEDHSTRYERAKTELKPSRIGKAITLSQNEALPKTIDGYASAIIRVTGRQLEVVALQPDQSRETVENAVVKLVEPEGARVSAYSGMIRPPVPILSAHLYR